jgi:DNA-binding NarL/FixJ family response regulator
MKTIEEILAEREISMRQYRHAAERKSPAPQLGTDRREDRMARILIADDRESIRTALRVSIGAHPGWRVCGEANDGREVVTKAAELQPDLVVLDFKMPVANGIQASSELSVSMPTIPIVMYTLHKTPELEVAAKLVGIRQVIGKKDGAKDLLAAIETALETKKSE